MKNISIILIIFIVFLIFVILRVYQIKNKRIKLTKALNSNFFIQVINNAIEENKYNLLEERIRLRKIDPYGNEDLKKWIGNPPLNEIAIEKNIFYGSKLFKEGIPYFWKKVILKKFGSTELFFEKWKSYCSENPIIDDEILGITRKLKNEDWFVFIASQIEKSCLNLIEDNYSKKSNQRYKKGLKFENHCMEILKQNGWEVKETPITGDQGVDLIASIKGLRICIQCKDHEKAIGNKAVQEISAGKLFWKGTHAILVKKIWLYKVSPTISKLE